MGIGWVSYSGAIEREGILSNDLSFQWPVKIEIYHIRVEWTKEDESEILGDNLFDR